MRSSESSDPTVFISHRGQETALAGKLATEIQQAGFQVWFDEWDIHIGDSIVERINNGLENAWYLILCYSNIGVLSPPYDRGKSRRESGMVVKPKGHTHPLPRPRGY